MSKSKRHKLLLNRLNPSYNVDIKVKSNYKFVMMD